VEERKRILSNIFDWHKHKKGAVQDTAPKPPKEDGGVLKFATANLFKHVSIL
jgi:hypothetical protein